MEIFNEKNIEKNESDFVTIPEKEKSARIRFSIVCFFLIGIGDVYLLWAFPFLRERDQNVIILVIGPLSLFVSALFCRFKKGGGEFRSKGLFGLSLVFLGAFGFTIIFLISVVYFVNCFFDRSKLETHEVFISDVESYPAGRRSRKSNFIFFPDWKYPGKTIRFQDPTDFYSTVKIGDKIEIDTMKGYLGFEWIKSFRKAGT